METRGKLDRKICGRILGQIETEILFESGIKIHVGTSLVVQWLRFHAPTGE